MPPRVNFLTEVCGDHNKTYILVPSISTAKDQIPQGLGLYRSGEEYFVAKHIASKSWKHARRLREAQNEGHVGGDRIARIEYLHEDSRLMLCRFIANKKSSGSSGASISWKDRAPDLMKLRSDHGSYTLYEAWGIVSQVAAVIHWLAPMGGHGDLKPDNILLTKEGENKDEYKVFVVDFVNPPADGVKSATVPDIQQLVWLLLFLLGCEDRPWDNPGLRNEGWIEFARQEIEKQRSLSGVDKKQIREALEVIKGASENTAKTIEDFIEHLRRAPNISPVPIPVSVGFILAQTSGLILCGFLCMMTGWTLMPYRVQQWWPLLIATVTPTPLIVTYTPTVTPTAATPTATATSTLTPSAPVTLTLTATAVTLSPTVTALTATPTASPGVVGKATHTPTATPTPTSTPLIPPECIENEIALHQVVPPFGFVQPKSGKNFSADDGFQIRVGEYNYYTIRYVVQGKEGKHWDYGKWITKIVDWPSIDKASVCSTTSAGIRCQRPVVADNLSGGVLTVLWNQPEGITANARYAFLLELERESENRTDFFCAYISNVDLTN